MDEKYNRDEVLIGEWILGFGGTFLLPPIYFPNLVIGVYEIYMQYSEDSKSYEIHQNDYIAGYFEWCKNMVYGTILVVILLIVLLVLLL